MAANPRWRCRQEPYAAILALLQASPLWHGLITLAPTRRLADRMLAHLIATDPDPVLRLDAIERLGCECYFAAQGTPALDRGPFGQLFVTGPPESPTALVRVEDAVRDPDGRPHVHWLPVPPDMVSAREAVAWTFGKSAAEWGPVQET
jgi:hypothetical protein